MSNIKVDQESLRVLRLRLLAFFFGGVVSGGSAEGVPESTAGLRAAVAFKVLVSQYGIATTLGVIRLS